MSGHVTEKIGDLLAGRLEPAERSQVEAHVKECPACASEIAWTESLREQAMRQGVRHLPASRIVELAGARSTATPAEQEHLAACARCQGELRWAEQLPAASEAGAAGGGPASPLVPGKLRPGRLWLLVGAAAAAVLLLLVPRLGGPDLPELAVVEPLPVRISRAIPEPGSFEEQRLLGMEAYASEDYETARRSFAQALERRPGDPVVSVYLGSTLLLQGEPEQAADALRAAAETATDAGLRDEASWQLANARLLAADGEEAREILQALADEDGHRRADAARLLESLP